MDRGKLISYGRTAEVFTWKDSQILKLCWEEFPASLVEYEARITDAAHKAGLPVPAVNGVVEIDGRTGIIFERVSGYTMGGRDLLKPWELVRRARTLAKLHVKMHSCNLPEAISQRERLEQKIRTAPGLTEDMRGGILNLLWQLPDGDVLCHGDFHPRNVIISPRGPIIIDWMTATRGNPAADIARTSLLLRLATRAGDWALERSLTHIIGHYFYPVYLKKYLELRYVSRQQISAWIPVIAAARLSDPVPRESNKLLALVKKALKPK
jgi:tRNA A-37 threonylcarbamoyl transferase component Bud32